MLEFEGQVLSTTKKAVLFQGNYWHRPLWLPRSQILLDDEGGEWYAAIKPWLCRKNFVGEFKECLFDERN